MRKHMFFLLLFSYIFSSPKHIYIIKNENLKKKRKKKRKKTHDRRPTVVAAKRPLVPTSDNGWPLETGDISGAGGRQQGVGGSVSKF